MAVTVAGAAPDLNFGPSATARTIVSAGCSIVAGWWRLTSMAQFDTLWAASGATYVNLNNASGRTAFWIDRTTDAEYRSDGNVMSSSTWVFLAIVLAGQSTIDAAIWAGTETTIPTKRASTFQSTGLGNIVNATQLWLGTSNNGSNQMAGSFSQIIAISHDTAITNIALNDDYVFNRFIYPIYNGTFDLLSAGSAINGTVISDSNSGCLKYIPLDSGPSAGTYPGYEFFSGSTGAQRPAITHASSVSDSTFSSAEPRCNRFSANITNGPLMPLLLRR